MFVGYPPSIKVWKFWNPISNRRLLSCDAVFLEDQFIETHNRHESRCGQTSCVGCDCVAHREDSNEEEESEVEVALNTEYIAEVADVILGDVNLLSFLLRCSTRPHEWGTQWEFLVMLTTSIYSYNQHTRKHLCRHFLCLASSIK